MLNDVISSGMGFTSKPDLLQQLDYKPLSETTGQILGEKDGNIVSLREKSDINHNIAVFGGPGSGNRMFDACKPESSAASAFSSYQNMGNEKIRASIQRGLIYKLQVLPYGNIRKITSRNDIDLTLPAKQKCAYFIELSDLDSSFNFLSSVFLSFCFQDLLEYADSQDSRHCDIPVNFILDEFPNIGKIPDFCKNLEISHSRGISVTILCQTIAQLQTEYSQEQEWRVLLDSFDAQICCPYTDSDTAEYFSKMSGFVPMQIFREIFSTNSISTESSLLTPYEKHLLPRVLFTPDEIRLLPEGQELLFLRGERPLILNKVHLEQF